MSDIDLSKLAEPFPAEDVEWRIGRSGEKNGRAWATCFAYIDNRAIQSRLDEVCGIGGWQNQLVQVSGGWLCGISIKINDEWVTKWDGSDATDFEAFKGGISGSQKRAASQWGIGRYLYNLEEGWADIRENGKFYQAKSKDHDAFKWNPPQLPAWALPKNQTPTPARQDGKHLDDRRTVPTSEYKGWVDCMNEIIVGKYPNFQSFGDISKHLMRMPKVKEMFKSWEDVERCSDLRVFDRFSAIINEAAGRLVAA